MLNLELEIAMVFGKLCFTKSQNSCEFMQSTLTMLRMSYGEDDDTLFEAESFKTGE